MQTDKMHDMPVTETRFQDPCFELQGPHISCMVSLFLATLSFHFTGYKSEIVLSLATVWVSAGKTTQTSTINSQDIRSYF